MKRFVVFVLLVCYLSYCACANDTVPKRGYVFTAPKKLLAGTIERGCLSLHNLKLPAQVTLNLLTNSSGEETKTLSTASSIIRSGSSEPCLDFLVPETEYSTAILQLKITLDNDPTYIVDEHQRVTIERESLITFVETDKPIYKPGQDVNIRALILQANLKPWTDTVSKIWIENPSGVRVVQWTNISMKDGMIQLKFPLPPEPNLGIWKINLERSGSESAYTTTFEVKKYVLPRFEVTISSPDAILGDAENITWDICGKYTYGKPVKGTLHLVARAQAPWHYTEHETNVTRTMELDSPDGCTRLVISTEELEFLNPNIYASKVSLVANLTEAGTQVTETATSEKQIERYALKFDFQSSNTKFTKQGVPYRGKVLVKDANDIPAADESVQLCIDATYEYYGTFEPQCQNFTSSSDGFIEFSLIPNENMTSFSLSATSNTHHSKYYPIHDGYQRQYMRTPMSRLFLNSWNSPSHSFIDIAPGNGPIVCDEEHTFEVLYTRLNNETNDEPILFEYFINSNGNLFSHDSVTQQPNTENEYPLSELPNLLNQDALIADMSTRLHRLHLKIKVTPDMSPESELLVYYVRPDGEVVAGSYKIEVGECFKNKVKTSWGKEVQTPGTVAQYHIEAAPLSLCGVSATDKSTLLLANGKTNLVTVDKVQEQLKKFQTNPDYYSYWENFCDSENEPPLPLDPESFVRAKRRIARPFYFGGGSNMADAKQAFDDFGGIVMSDLTVKTLPCINKYFSIPFRRGYAAPAAVSLAVERVENDVVGYHLTNEVSPAEPTLRSYFPETWLWELVPTGNDGKATLERMLPHTITDWIGNTVCLSPTQGIGIAPPATIRAFQPFFLDYSLPYSVKRGETLRMKVSLFNYMQHSLPVQIKLEDAMGFNLLSNNSIRSYCVKGQSSIVQEYLLQPTIFGEVNVTVSAAVDEHYPKQCGPDFIVYTSDAIVKSVLVVPEGFPVQVTKSAFLCPKNSDNDSMVVWNLDLPDDLVPGSERAFVSLIGDLMGPVFENLDQLVHVPFGCGEQNMILFVPNIHVVGYLDTFSIRKPELRASAIKNMKQGYLQELTFRHPEGSYSAFGPHSYTKEDGSIWLTAFVVKSFAQARNLIQIDEKDLQLSVDWIVSKQLQNGCFPTIGMVHHRDLKGGLQSEDSASPALTAYILISLFETSLPISKGVVDGAVRCLQNGITNPNNKLYDLALSTYALALINHPTANSSMKLLLDRATHSDDLLWWENKVNPSLAVSIEMTAYAVLSLVKFGGDENLATALSAIRWMSKQRNAEGGFVSTQDTIIALEALTKYAMSITVNKTNLMIHVNSDGIDRNHQMNEDNRLILEEIRLPVLPTQTGVSVSGDGCVLAQANVKYNVRHAPGSDTFDLMVETAAENKKDICSTRRITACARYRMENEESNMALLEIGMISGYVPDETSLNDLPKQPDTKVKRVENERGTVNIYFDKLTNNMTCVSFVVIRENVVDRLQPGNVKLYDYYQQERIVSTKYKFPKSCNTAEAN